MKKKDIVRALRDEEYFLSLSDEERAQVPASAAGAVELSDADLGVTSGAGITGTCCTEFPDTCGYPQCFTC